MIDLHIHTIHSDGTDTVNELLDKAEKLGIKTISITDHDNIKAYLKLKKTSHNYSGRIINGVEIKTSYNKIPIEILAYNFDLNTFKNSLCIKSKNVQDIQNKYLKNYQKVATKLGLKYTKDLIIQNSKSYAAITFYYDLIKYPENFIIFPELKNIPPEAFYRYTSSNPNSPFYIDETLDYPEINFVINEIHKANGLAFIAHPYLYQINNHQEFIQSIFDNTNIDGCECYHTAYTEDQITNCLKITKQNNKLISGGSDYHGNNKKDYYIGIIHNKQIPSNEITWIN